MSLRRQARRILELLRGARSSTELDPATCAMTSDHHQALLVQELVKVAEGMFEPALGLGKPPVDYPVVIQDFIRIYKERPFRANRGGSGFHNAFWLFLIAKSLSPKLIVESGVWKGHSSWLLRQACPDAVIHCCDPDLSRLEVGRDIAHFHAGDWTTVDMGAFDPAESMVFFDCHVNHARRIMESKQRGFRHLLFDDDPPAHKLYGYGLPGAPTASMIWDWNGRDAGRLEWTWLGQRKSCVLEPRELEAAKSAMAIRKEFPDVGASTLFGGFSFLSYVRLQ